MIFLRATKELQFFSSSNPPAKNDTSWLPRSEIAKFYGNSEEHVADLWNSIREKVHPTLKPGVL
jgi:hypothetical protein